MKTITYRTNPDNTFEIRYSDTKESNDEIVLQVSEEDFEFIRNAPIDKVKICIDKILSNLVQKQ